MDNREIDRQIAEKVMGWKEKYHGMTDSCRFAYSYWVDSLGIQQYDTGKGTSLHQFLWQPTTNIAHAFEVVEKMRDNGWTFAICNNNVLGGDYCGEFWNDEHPMDSGEFMKFDNSPAMAICLAALEAVKGEG